MICQKHPIYNITGTIIQFIGSLYKKKWGWVYSENPEIMGNLENICDKHDSISINTPLNTSMRHIYSQEREKTNLYFPEKFEKLRANKRQPNHCQILEKQLDHADF